MYRMHIGLVLVGTRSEERTIISHNCSTLVGHSFRRPMATEAGHGGGGGSVDASPPLNKQRVVGLPPPPVNLSTLHQKRGGGGGVHGPNAEFIRLVSSDGFDFCIKKELVFQSGTLRSMMSGPSHFLDGESNCIVFHDIPSYVLVEVCKYFGYKARYSNTTKASEKCRYYIIKLSYYAFYSRPLYIVRGIQKICRSDKTLVTRGGGGLREM